MKRWTVLFLSLLIIVSVSPAGYASGGERVIDDAMLLTQDECSALEDQAGDIYQDYEMDVVIVTTVDTGGKSVQTYADDYYDENGYGWGENATGVLLLVNMDTREWYISTCGDAIYILTDYALDTLGNELAYFLSQGLYYMAFENFMSSLPQYIRAYDQGRPVDGYVEPDTYWPESGDETVYYHSEPDYGGIAISSLVIGLVTALVAVLVMRSRMNTAKFQKHAGNYLVSGTYRLHTSRDMFLYSQVSKRPRQQNNSGRPGGGSSVHRSSGGRSHGGRGGRF